MSSREESDAWSPVEFHRPRLIDAVSYIAISGGRVAFRNSAAGRVVLVVRLTETVARELVTRLDGTRGWDQICAEMIQRHDGLTPAELAAVLARISEAGLLEEGAAETNLDRHQLMRYSRNLACFGAQARHMDSKFAVQERLTESRILILGIGGIGTNTALGLAMLGVGSFLLVDFDVVELQNLNRQALFDLTVVGRSKAEVAVERLSAINSDLTYQQRTIRIQSARDIVQMITEFRPDMTVLGADRPFLAIDRWTSAASWQCDVPYITGTVNGGYGAVWTRIPGRTGCEECVLLWARDNDPDEYEVALQRQRNDILPLTSALGVGAQIVGGLIGFDVYHHLIGQPVSSAGVRRHIDFDRLTIEDRPQPAHPGCGCGSRRPTTDG